MYIVMKHVPIILILFLNIGCVAGQWDEIKHNLSNWDELKTKPNTKGWGAISGHKRYIQDHHDGRVRPIAYYRFPGIHNANDLRWATTGPQPTSRVMSHRITSSGKSITHTKWGIYRPLNLGEAERGIYDPLSRTWRKKMSWEK
jgi:hypothetical protein